MYWHPRVGHQVNYAADADNDAADGNADIAGS